MTDLHITWVDIAVLAILILSTILAVARGFVRETLSIFAWAAAAFATLYFGHYVVPLLAPHMAPMLAQFLAYAAVFFAVLIPLLFIGSRFSRRVHESAIGGLDRVLGALFGIARGLVAIAVLYILYSLVVPVPAQAKWIMNARTLPLIQKSASALLSLLPGNDAQYVQERTLRQSHAGTAADETSSPRGNAALAPAETHHRPVHKSYGATDRRALNRLIETTGGGGNKP